MGAQTLKLNYRVDRRQINLIRFTIEAYEGLAVVSTLDAASGLISLAVAPECAWMAKEVMNDLGKSILIIPVETADEVDEKEQRGH